MYLMTRTMSDKMLMSCKPESIQALDEFWGSPRNAFELHELRQHIWQKNALPMLISVLLSYSILLYPDLHGKGIMK